MVGDAGVMDITGNGFTTTVRVAVSVQPFVPVPVTVYIVVAAGCVVTAAPVDVPRPARGSHE